MLSQPSFELNYICSEVRDTSHKPDELYGIAERLVDNNDRKLVRTLVQGRGRGTDYRIIGDLRSFA